MPNVTPPSAAPSTSPDGIDWLPWLLGAAGVVLAAVIGMRLRRERSGKGLGPVDEPMPDASPEPVAAQAAGLSFALRPIRAGLNMVTAITDCELTIVNEGAVAAERVRVALTLVAAHGGQQALVDAINDAPITRTIVSPFALMPGEARVMRALASTPLAQLQRLQANGREMLVPLILVNVEHDADGVTHRTSQGFVVGVERVDSPKLAPFWLDALRMFDQVAARPSGGPTQKRVA